MKRIVVFTGAGVSAESGLKTFRDSGGLWEEYAVEEVATPEAWKRDPQLVLTFYNKRRKQVVEATPNAAHKAIAALESKYDVRVITQNIDDLHERAGSSNVLHLHGEIMKSRSTADENLLYPISGNLELGDHCELGSQLRPHVVWFGEQVPEIPHASSIMSGADIVLIVGTSLNVYPAAGVVLHAPPHARRYLVDPASVDVVDDLSVKVIKGIASEAVPLLVQQWLQESEVD